MYQIAVGFQPTNRDQRLDGRHIHARGLHGILFTVLKAANPDSANWLHTHPAPKPFSMAPYYTQEGNLVGLRYAAITEEAATVLATGWQQAYQQQVELTLGRYQSFIVRDVEIIPHIGFQTLSESAPAREMILDFVSPTVFRQGPGTLPLPLPKNVFGTPMRVWKAYASEILGVPDNWREWCERNIFIIDQNTHTVTAALTREQSFVGFVGRVHYRAHAGSDYQLRLWQALGRLAAFTGTGYKTTMGMGTVAFIGVEV